MPSLKAQLIDVIKKAVLAAQAAGDFPLDLVVPEIVVERPENIAHGDFAIPLAMLLAKSLKKNPLAIADILTSHIEKIDIIEQVETVAPGFINFFLTRPAWVAVVAAVNDKPRQWGKTNKFAGKKVMVEYTDPNPFKPFHIGHLMTNAIGESVARLVEFGGAQIRRANYQGDIGLHVAKAIWGLQQLDLDPGSIEDLGRAYAHGHASYENNEQAKQDIIAINKSLYANDPKLRVVYQAGRQASLDHFEKIYQELGTKFDHYFFESETWKIGKKEVAEGLTQGIFAESNGAIIFRGEEHGLHTRVFLTADGIPTYEAKDLGLIAMKRAEFDFNISLVVTANEQASYFDVMFKAYSLLHPAEKAQHQHISHGLMRLVSGKMGSRHGNVITGESLLHNLKKHALDYVAGRGLDNQAEQIAAKIAVAAIKYSILKIGLGRDIVFDPESALSFTGDSGPYLQYTSVRAGAVLRKAAQAGVVMSTERPLPETNQIERLLERFPDVVEKAQAGYEPQHVAAYLIELASAFNAWYAQEKIVDAGDETSSYKLSVTSAVKTTIDNGLWLLGIEVPVSM